MIPLAGQPIDTAIYASIKSVKLVGWTSYMLYCHYEIIVTTYKTTHVTTVAS